MPIQKLKTTDAFLVIDLAGAPSAGIVRSAPKILQGTAKDLARSLTYAFATLEIQRGGASAGINTKPEKRESAISAFVDELKPQIADGSLSLTSGKGVPPNSLTAFEEIDDRGGLASQSVGLDNLATYLAGLGPVVAAEHALGNLETKRVAIEGFGPSGAALATAAINRGARIVAIATRSGVIQDPRGFELDDIRSQWDSNRDDLVGEKADPAWKIFGVEAEVLFVGSKIGAINHGTAAGLNVKAVVPHSALPFSARALAVMQRSGITVIPDFIPTSIPLLAYWPDTTDDVTAIIDRSEELIGHAIKETSGHTDGLFLAACYRAEAYLATWRDELPFGRPLAS